MGAAFCYNTRRDGRPSGPANRECACPAPWCSMESLRLTDLVDADILQRMQDSFAAAMRLRVLIRDGAGQPLTRASEPTRIAELADCATLRHQCGPPLPPEEAKAWAPTADRPFAVVRFTEPIGTSQLCLGAIEVLVLLARGDLSPACLAHFHEEHTGNPEDLLPLLRERASWGAQELDAIRDLLRSIADLLSAMCQRGYESVQKVRELLTLYDLSTLMTQTMDLQGRLDLLTKATTETLGVKGCLIRLLDEANGELNVKSVYNLSRRYLEKGPVNLSDSAVDQEAILGRLVYVLDVTLDPRTLYPREMAEEGLHSMLCVALRSKGRAIGTIRAYTDQPHEFTEDQQRLLQAIANQAAAAIENSTLYEEALRARSMDAELAAAAQIQRHLIPARDPVIPGFEIASRYVPFGIVGGDLYDLVPIQNQHLGIVIADVAGKGVPAAILMAATRAVLRGSIETVYSARDIIAKTNHLLCRDIAEEQFITLFYGALDTVNRRLTYCNAGHAAPILFRGAEHCELVEGGLVLGVEPRAVYEERQFFLRKGDVIVFYTDGLTETMNPESETFDRARLADAISGHLAEPAAEILDRVWHAVRDFARGTPPRDDFTIIVLKVL